MSLVRDEKGKLSSARVAMWLVLLWSVSLVTAEAVGWITLSGGAYGFIGAAVIALISWAGGPRIAQHIGGQISGVASALSRARGTDNRFEDDERDL